MTNEEIRVGGIEKKYEIIYTKLFLEWKEKIKGVGVPADDIREELLLHWFSRYLDSIEKGEL